MNTWKVEGPTSRPRNPILDTWARVHDEACGATVAYTPTVDNAALFAEAPALRGCLAGLLAWIDSAKKLAAPSLPDEDYLKPAREALARSHETAMQATSGPSRSITAGPGGTT